MRLPLTTPWFKRVIIAGAIIGPFLYALIVNFSALHNPPAWDSAITVSPAALSIVEFDFDIGEVARLPSSPEGGPSTHATSLYTIGLAALIALLGPASAFYVAHLSSLVLVAALAGATYLLARQRASVHMSALTALVVGIMPVVIQQSADIYLDLPLAVLATLACWTALRRDFWWTAGLVLVAVAVKTSGVFLLPLILFAKPTQKSLRRHLINSALAGLVAIIPFLVVLATTHRFVEGARSSFDPILLRSSAALLVMTIDVMIVLSIFLMVMYGRTRSRSLDRYSKVSGSLVATFFIVHLGTILFSGTIAILPRYYIAILPAVLIAMLPEQQTSTATTQEPAQRSPAHIAVTVLLGTLGLFSMINVEGDFYPLADHDFYVAAERSTRAQDLLELQVEGTRELVSTGLPLLVERQVHFRLVYPGMGYVDTVPEDMTSIFIQRLDELPDEFAMLMERRFTNPLVPIEEAALEQGYALDYETLSVGPFESELIVASR